MAAALAFFAIQVFCPAPAAAKDYGNVLRRKQEGTLEEKKEKKQLEDYEKDYDTSLRIYLTSAKDVFKPGETPTIDVYVRNEANETRFFKNIWTTNSREGVGFKTIFDGRETPSSGMFVREIAVPESADPARALQLDPGRQALVMKIKFGDVPEGEHTLEVEYQAAYSVTEKHKRTWWNGICKSNSMTIRAARVVPEKELAAAAAAVIGNIHSDILKIKVKYPEIAKYGDGNKLKPGDALLGIPVIDFSGTAPKRRRINIYFQKPDHQPSTLTTFEEEFPYLGIKLFAHLDTGDDARLRGALLESVKKHKKDLYATTKKIAKNVRVEVEPFGPEMSKRLRRASFIVYGTIVGKQIEDIKPGDDYNIRKWILTVAVKKVYLGSVKDKKIIIKSGALTTFFGNENVVDNDFILLLGDRNNWQKDYTLLGVEPARQNLMQWLDVKYAKGQ